FSFMGCQYNAAAGSPADRRSQNSRLIREACQSISIQDCGCLACERCQHFVPHRWANAAARAQDRGVSSFVGEELAKLRHPVGRPMTATLSVAFIARASRGLAIVTRPAPARSAPRAANLAAPVVDDPPETTTAWPREYLCPCELGRGNERPQNAGVFANVCGLI